MMGLRILRWGRAWAFGPRAPWKRSGCVVSARRGAWLVGGGREPREQRRCRRPGGQSKLSPAVARRKGLASTALLPASNLQNQRSPRL